MNDNERQSVTMMLILAIFVGVLSPLIFYLTQKEVSPEAKKYILDTLNFQLTLTIIVVAMSFIPIINLIAVLACPVVLLLNLIVCINAYNTANKNMPYNYPFSFNLIK